MPKRTVEDPVAQYLSEIQHNLSSSIAREQTHRPALKDLVESLDPSIDAFNDPKHIDVGAPDFTIRRKGHATDFPVGWIETKDVGEDLAKVEKSEQLQRYFGLHNLIQQLLGASVLVCFLQVTVLAPLVSFGSSAQE
jgi:hypothetical protein